MLLSNSHCTNNSRFGSVGDLCFAWLYQFTTFARPSPLANRRDSSVSDLPPSTILLCSGISKMTASFATYPHEVIRTRLQVQLTTHQQSTHPLSFASLVITTRTLLQESGWRGLYKGLSINLMRTVPNSGLTLLTSVQ